MNTTVRLVGTSFMSKFPEKKTYISMCVGQGNQEKP